MAKVKKTTLEKTTKMCIYKISSYLADLCKKQNENVNFEVVVDYKKIILSRFFLFVCFWETF